MVRPVFFPAYATCWYEFLTPGRGRLFGHFRTSFPIFLNFPVICTHSHTIKSTNRAFPAGRYMQRINSPVPADYSCVSSLVFQSSMHPYITQNIIHNQSIAKRKNFFKITLAIFGKSVQCWNPIRSIGYSVDAGTFYRNQILHNCNNCYTKYMR